LLETASVAIGYKTADAVLWESQVEMLFCEPVSAGKLVMLFTGEVEEVRSSIRRGMEVAEDDLVEQILIPNLEGSILDALRGRFSSAVSRALGVIETTTVGATILAADVAVKTAAVAPVELRLGNQLGGKAFVTLAGEVGDVRAAVGAGAAIAEERGHLVREVVIAGPHPDLARYLRPGAPS
jgi:microcompartment protein CcmL/EutN